MPELLRKQILGWPLACAVSLAVIPALSRAESIPATVRACAGETNADARLACYDKEVGRFLAPGEKSVTRTTSAAPPSASNTVPPAATTPAASDTTSDDSKHLTAHVLSIERIPNEMILHLDNGQVWQEAQSVPGDLSLREGDAVKIDKHFGSYWLSGPHVSSMKVRQKS